VNVPQSRGDIALLLQAERIRDEDSSPEFILQPAHFLLIEVTHHRSQPLLVSSVSLRTLESQFSFGSFDLLTLERPVPPPFLPTFRGHAILHEVVYNTLLLLNSAEKLSPLSQIYPHPATLFSEEPGLVV